MATDTKMNEKKLRLLSLLREMFQLDQPDLDFGLYRIMHAKRAQVETFLDSEFDQLIDKVFASRGARHEEAAKQEYEAARQQAIEFCAPDPDAVPKVQQARARYDAVRLTGGEDAEIYDHLHRFFSRYYDEGDFMSLRRYGKGAAGGAETYAVPYDGSEVVLHWANKDQYYIKTTENFSYFSFDPRKALQKDERGISRQLFEEAGTDGPALKVHLRVVDAAEGAHNNVKASEKDERYFLLDNGSPIVWEGTELVIRINYRPDTDKPSRAQKGKWQTDRNDQLVLKVLDALDSVEGDGKALALEYRTVLAREVPKGKDKKQPLLARYVGQYTASNTMDYFIHKDLGGFLGREMDFYLKNEVLKLDDFVGGEDSDVLAGGIAEARMKAMQSALEKAQAIRLLSQRMIDFLAQLEDFQKKLWLKKKFVVAVDYSITLDRIPEKFYPEIAANDRLREEWVRLFAIDEITGDEATTPYAVPLTVEFLKANQFLLLDTAHFPESFQQRLLAEIDGLDEQCNGVLFHSDNFQALRMMQARYGREIDCTYIDPPYNTDASSITYKNGYKSSSWIALLDDRLHESRSLLTDKGVLVAAIDDVQQKELGYLINANFDGNELGTICVRANPSGRPTQTGYSVSHEYLLFAGNSSSSSIGRLPPTDDQMARFNQTDDQGSFEWRNLRREGSNSDRSARRGLYYPIFIKGQSIRVPAMTWDDTSESWILDEVLGDGEQAVYPNNEDGDEKTWRWEGRTVMASLDQLAVRPDRSGRDYIYYKRRPNEAGVVSVSSWFDAKYSATEHGTAVLKALFGKTPFDYPKSIHAVVDAVYIAGGSSRNALVLDYFGGSGTTGHAVISLNRRDAGHRKYVLTEMGNHMDTALLPRLKKVVYAPEWSNGKPENRANGISHCIKKIRLESYEDCLNNLALNAIGEAIVKAGDGAMLRDYLLRYMLDVETKGSQSLLNVAQFRDPTAYQLEIKKPGSDERERRNVDLVETFNWLVGLHVDKLHAGRRFAATFVRNPDPLLPEDTNTRLQVETLTEAKDGAWWFRPVEGYVRTKPGDDRHRQSVLVLWRTLTDDPEQDAAALEAFLSQQMKFDPTRREDKTLYDIIYINGTHNLPNLGKYGEVRLLEEEFQRRMWAGEDA